ncbi:hypothetical protein HY488_01685, partial [Candidatus Woesearchaeota archaeon]|nr:hypothetical protein [Candidatus Woesearchaeota archaeon]
MVLVIKVPVEDIAAKIKEKAGISDEELNRKVRQKMDQLAGLISREGALHILANEYNVKLYEDGGRLKIRSLLSGMRNVELLGKVIDVYEVREFQTKERKGKVGSLLLADETGKIRIVLWGGQTDQLANMKKNDVLLAQGAYVKDNQGRRELHLGDSAKLLVNPEGERVELGQPATLTRKSLAELQENDQDVEILGTIVQVSNLTFFEVCPQCNKRVRLQGDRYVCDPHGTVTPNLSYVLNLFLDDGSGNIRTVFFRNQVNNLLGKSQEEILAYQNKPENFEQVKHDLLGKMIKIVGRASKNTLFDRIEFTAQRVYPNPNPEEELQRLGGMSQIPQTAPLSTFKKEIIMTTSANETVIQAEEETINGDDAGGNHGAQAEHEVESERKRKVK